MDGLFKFIGCTLGLILILSACSAPNTSPSNTASPVSLRKLGEQDAGTTVTLPVNGKLDLSLAGNPTSGFQWEVSAGDSAVIKQVGDPEYVADTSALGSGGILTFHFAALAAGQTKVQLIYHRPFEKNVPPAKTFEFTAIVK